MEGGSLFGKNQPQPFFQPALGKDVPVVQTKLSVNKPGDKFEKEADTMADKVVRMPAPLVKDDKMLASPTSGKIQKAELKDEKVQKAEMKDEKVQKAEVKEEKIQKAEVKDEKVQKAEAKDEKLQRKETAVSGGMTGATQSAIQGQKTGGTPISNDVRSYMEPRFGADFSNVRIHNDQDSASLNNQLSARAFTYQNHIFFSRDQYQPGTGEGKQLLAHELTHTIQQGHSSQHTDNVSTSATPPAVQRFGLQDALDKFAEWAYNIPGFRLLTIILGFNPVNMRNTDRSAANILRGLIELIPGGHFITQALDNHGVINKAATWVEQKISALGDIGSEITGGLKRFVDSLSWRDIFDLGGVWDRAKAIFTGPIGRLIAFGGTVVTELLKMVKDAILKPLAALAEGTSGYDLLKAVLGQDPITGEPVPRNADTLIGGFMKLIGQQEVWENIKKGNAIAKAWAWFQGALSGLMGFVRSIPGKIIQTLRSLTFMDIVTVVGAFIKIGSAFLNIAGEFISWAGAQVISLLEIIFSVVAPNAVPYIKKAQGAFQTIIKDPIGFVGNLVRAGKLGFQNFAGNILTHLKTALIKWLTGPLGDAGVYIPKSFSLMEIVKLVLSVLGLTWTNIRSKLVKIIPEPVLVVLEKTAGILVTLVKDGPAAAWEEIKTELTELKDQLIAQITQMVTVEIVKAAVMKLVSMLNPAGAVIQAIIAIYNTITFFIQKINQIAAVVASFIDSIAAIASGQVDAAAKKVEQVMANTLVVIIGFLAKLVGLGNVPDKLVGIVKKIRQPIDKGLDKIVAWLGGVLKKIKTAISSFFSPKPFSVESEPHKLYSDESGNPMVSSDPERLEKALADLGGDVSKAATLETLNKQLKKETDEKKQKDLNKKIDKLINEIIADLVKLKYGTGTKKTMPLATVTFDPKGNIAEFKRQVQMQEKAMKKMEVGEWQMNRAQFIGFGRDEETDTDLVRRQEIVARLISQPAAAIKALVTNGLLSASDQKKVNTILADKKITDKEKALDGIGKTIMDSYGSRKLAVLHKVDQVAGGSATDYGDKASVFGKSAENSRIGSQWRKRIEIVDAAAKNVKPKVKVNVKLNA